MISFIPNDAKIKSGQKAEKQIEMFYNHSTFSDRPKLELAVTSVINAM